MARYPQNRGRYGRGGRNQTRRNEMIRVREIRVIGPDGNQIGVMPTQEALKIAKEHGLDLVEIAGDARPPVCRILDFGKYRYEQAKKKKDNAATSTTSKLKEVKFRVRIETHDYMTKLRRAEDFLFKGNKVKLNLMFRGREMEHTDLGFKVINNAAKELEHVASVENAPRLNGRFVNMVLAPLPANRRKRKYTSEDDADDAFNEEADSAASPSQRAASSRTD